MRRKRSHAGQIAGCIIMLSGILLFLCPDISTWIYEHKAQEEILAYREVNLPEESTDEDAGETGKDPGSASDTKNIPEILPASDALLEQIKAYNLRIYEEKQKDFKDAWSVTQVPQVLDGIGDEMFGYIEIPAMDVKMPLYIGASTDHLAKGAAVLGETSIPIGGINTNAAIAGHRGWRGVPYFREIEKIAVGDEVYVTNPWETLVYRASEIRIITPDDSDAVKIQEGRDMITLITCHPYRSGGKYRYLVFCERSGSVPLDVEADKDLLRPASDTTADIMSGETKIPMSSQEDLEREHMLRRMGLLLISGMTVLLIIRSGMERKKKK